MISSTTTQINLNADLGESFGAWIMGNDTAMLDIINSANLACGFHAGDPLVMTETVCLAKQKGVSIGAHPSYPDLQGFGRRKISFTLNEIRAMVIYQIGALQAIAHAGQYEVTHVKVHGALSNQACIDSDMASAIVEAVYSVDRTLVLLAPALSALESSGKQAGLQVALEIFADRTYQDDGQLTPRSISGSVIHSPQKCLENVKNMLTSKGIISTQGKVLKTDIHSICVHGDNPNAIESARLIHDFLSQNKYQLVTLANMF